MRKGKFQLVGHSFGCLVALEIAAVLEREGLIGTIILIDGAPKSSVEFTIQIIGNVKGSQMETKILERIIVNMLPAKEAYHIMVNTDILLSSFTEFSFVFRVRWPAAPI